MIGYYPINPASGSVEEDAFGPRFFRAHFFDRMRQACLIDDMTPVLELMLTSGQVVDVAHIIELKQDYMLVAAFIDSRDCSQVFQAYIRYITIYRINVLNEPRAVRPIGFEPHEPKGMHEGDNGAAQPAPRKPKKKKH